MGKFFYARVSSKDQNLARQIEAFKKMGAADEQIVCDKESGKNFNRENYKALKSALGLRAGDVLIVKELDRFGRNKQEILKELEYWKKREIRVMVIDIPTTMIDIPKGQEWIMEMINNILIEVLSSIAEQERDKIRQRQREGIDCMPVKNGKKVSMKTGRPVGRPEIKKPNNWSENYEKWVKGEITAKKAMENCKLKRSSFYKLVNEE